MELLLVTLIVALVISLGFHLWAYRLQKTKAPRQPTLDARQMLHDLTRGGAILKVTVIDPDGLLIYRTQE